MSASNRSARRPENAVAARYVVEVTPAGDYADVRQLSIFARAAAAGMQAEGGGVRFVRAVYVPEDGTCLLVFEAGSANAAREAAVAADLSVSRVSAAIKMGGS